MCFYVPQEGMVFGPITALWLKLDKRGNQPAFFEKIWRFEVEADFPMEDVGHCTHWADRTPYTSDDEITNCQERPPNNPTHHRGEV